MDFRFWAAFAICFIALLSWSRLALALYRFARRTIGARRDRTAAPHREQPAEHVDWREAA